MQEKIIDYADAIDRVQEDEELLLELFDIFESDFKIRNKELKKSVAESNTEVVKNIAHSIKGAAGNISAKRIHAICLFIEKQASSDTLDGVGEQLAELDKEFEMYLVEAQKIRDKIS